jgi:acetoin:2,6-dichlorophenolindophenol oxidoreductase subunit beta
MAVMTYAQAALLALRQEMERDPLVWVLGEDLGPEGGVSGQYLGLQQVFGKQRVVDTPISESTIMGAAIGAAICGTRPVVELRYADFGICASDEIVNQAAKVRYMLGGQVRVPAVIRQPIGLRDGMAAQHSQSTEAWWIHIPGLVVVAPATPADNHGLLKAAVRSDDPVIYMEHKELWATNGEVDANAEPIAFGKAAVVRAGSDMTIVTWSSMVGPCLAAAERLSASRCTAEVIDLRTLWPWDREAVLESVAKTGRLLVVHQAVRVGGFGGEIVADVTEHLFDRLKTAPRRLGAPRTPIPFSEPLETACRISAERIVETALDMIRKA